jgi:serine/threonine-protein kinase
MAYTRQPELRDRFLREARVAASLAHPNIVSVHAVEAHGDIVYFVMEYVDGETLSRRVTRAGPMTPGDTTRLVQEVAWALAYAHGRGIVHRDVKPDNILVERATGRAFVTDFGIARVAAATRALTVDGHVMGTAQFMSPEQAAGEPVDGRSDIYALGVVAFFALTGTLPFEADNVPALLAMQMTRPAPPIASRRPGLPSRLARAVDRCLAKKPEDRFASAEALADELSGVEVPTASVPPQVRNFQRVAEQSTMMGMLVVLMSIAPLELAGPRWWATLGGPIGAILAVLVDLAMRARALVADGFGAGDVIRAFVLEEEAREAEVTALYRGDRTGRLRQRRRWSMAVGVVAFAALLVLARWQKFLTGFPQVTARVGIGVAFLVAVLGLAIAIRSSEKAERRYASRAGRLWRGRFTIWFFRLAGWGLRRDEQASPAFRERLAVDIPTVAKRRFPELPDLFDAAETALAALRRREEDVERALAEVGDDVPALQPALVAAEGAAPGVTTQAVLMHRRLALVSDLRAAGAAAQQRRNDLTAAAENVRIGLARLRAGVGDPADLEPDIAAMRALVTEATPSR